jgi:hypothetical protein
LAINSQTNVKNLLCDFPGNDYSRTPTISVLASGGFRPRTCEVTSSACEITSLACEVTSSACEVRSGVCEVLGPLFLCVRLNRTLAAEEWAIES